MTSPVDYDLHGLAGIRLLDARDEDISAVSRQIGLKKTQLDREPDIIIRFVDQLPDLTNLRYLGQDDAAFTEDAFLVLRGQHKTRARVKIPFEQIGKQCEIVCERGLISVPLLIPILNLAVLGNGALPLHASAFNYQGHGILAVGWAKGGKTETLLAFMAKGAEYVGDEWVYLTCDGAKMYGIPEPIRLWDWQLSEMPYYRSRLSKKERAKLMSVKGMIQALRPASGSGRSKSAPAKVAGRVLSLLKKQLYVQVPPERLFGRQSCTLEGYPKKIFFVASAEAPDIKVEPIDPLEIAKRMVFSLEEERLDLLSYYLKFRFAFPEKRNQLIEQSQMLQLEALERIMSGKEAYAVYHPYPFHIPALFDHISPYCDEIPGR